MELSPQSVAQATFKTVKKGYDPDEVRAYLARLATQIESTQTQAAAMEARARAAVARLQELAGQPAAPSPARLPEPAPAAARDVEEAQTISRTLLLAQRTADTTIAEATAEAKKIRDEADAVARHALDSAKETQARLVEEARAEVRRASEDQRVQIDSEVQSLLARREFLLSDVEHLEQHVISHRDRLREVANSLTTIADGASGGLADLRRPLMSAAGEATPALEPTMAVGRVPTLGAGPRTSAATVAPDAEADDSNGAVTGPQGAAGTESTTAETGEGVADGGDPTPGVAQPGRLPLADPTPPSGAAAADTDATRVMPTVPRLGHDESR